MHSSAGGSIFINRVPLHTRKQEAVRAKQPVAPQAEPDTITYAYKDCFNDSQRNTFYLNKKCLFMFFPVSIYNFKFIENLKSESKFLKNQSEINETIRKRE